VRRAADVRRRLRRGEYRVDLERLADALEPALADEPPLTETDRD
jgi:anti-sigma28 factor (negative regulator of flagellin synthesis)